MHHPGPLLGWKQAVYKEGGWTCCATAPPQGTTRAEHTMEQLRQIVNSNFPFLDFTLDVFKDSPIPVLDTQFWVGPASNNGPWYAPPGDSRSPPPPGDMERETAQVPIYMCEEQHVICSSCRMSDKVDKCPMCRLKYKADRYMLLHICCFQRNYR